MFSPKNLILLIALLWASFALKAQSCFIQEDDATGSLVFSTEELAELEAAACSLRAVFPTEFQNDFAVYDFGFYLHQQGYEGGMPQVFQDKIAEVAQESPYFLLFGRELLRGGALGKVWVEVQLPEEGSFSCLTADFYRMIEFEVRLAVSQTLGNSNTYSTQGLSQALFAGIQILESSVEEVVNCCEFNLNPDCPICNWTYDDVLLYFGSKAGTDQDPISILSDPPNVDHTCICATEYNVEPIEYVGGGYRVEKYSTIDGFDLYGETIDVGDLYIELKTLSDLHVSNGREFYGAITDNAVFCSTGENTALRNGEGEELPTMEDIENRFESSAEGVWIHFVYSENSATLFVALKGPTGEILLNTDRFPQYASKFYEVTETLKEAGGISGDFINIFENSGLNVEIRIEDIGSGVNGSTSSLSYVIDHRHVIIRIDEDRFSDEEYCNKEKLGYLYVAKTIIHECVHAILKHNLMKVSGATSDQKKRNFSLYSYGHYYSHYRNYNFENIATSYTEHWIILNHYFRKLSDTLHGFNGGYGNRTNYFYLTYDFGEQPQFSIEDIQRWTGFNDLETLISIENKMADLHELLKQNTQLPCTN
ncbi:MAG: hypothetical protein NXI25_15440 [bacterium]|jgi:hypothetical protein|nr:hypothetical protein [bacterium]